MPPPPAPFHELPSFAATAQGHDLAFHPSGAARWDALLALIDGARASLRLCFYTFADDEWGRAVVERLVAARGRGVEVALVIDSFGSADTADALFAPLREAGCRYCCFSPRWTVRYLIRNHQKLAVADGRRGMIGGFNIERDYFASPAENAWHDLGVQVEGPVVAALVRWFDKLEAWARNPHHQWRSIRRLLRTWDPGRGPVKLLLGGPTRGLSPWARAVSNDLIIGDRLDIAMAYFSPATRLLGRIGRIARKGQTRLLLAARSDNGATIGASRLLYGKLLKRGARIWEFSPCKLHMKLIVLDDAVYLGSANFDMRSLYINLELMVRIEDAALAERMRQFVSDHLPHAEEITRELHRERLTLWNRIRWGISWFLVNVIDYTVNRRLNLGL